MSEKQEAFSDIIEKMRRDGIVHNSIPTRYLNAYADRLEAALKRELSKICPKTGADFGQLGDCAKLREVLKTVKRYFDGYTVNVPEMRRQVDAALAAPPRNCDVGTEEEQQDRFREFCRHYENLGECGIGRYEAACPAFQGGRNPDCSLWWAQRPYEKGDAQ